MTRASFPGLQSISVNAGAGNDRITGSPLADTLNGGGGNDIIDGGAATDILIVDGDASSEAFRARSQGAALVIDTTGGTPLRLDVTGVERLTVNGNAGNDAFTLTDLTGVASLNRINFIGGTGSDTMAGPNRPTTWTLQTGTDWLVSDGFAGVVLFDVENLRGGAAVDLFVIVDGGGDLTFQGFTQDVSSIDGGGGMDTVIGPDESTTWTFTADNAGTLVFSNLTTATPLGAHLPALRQYAISFRAESVQGGRLADHFILANGVNISGRVDGGAGEDTLDYSAFATGAVVDFRTNTATGISGGIANIERTAGRVRILPETPNRPPVNIVPRRLVLRLGRAALLRLRILNRDAGRGRMRVILAVPRGRFLLDRRLLRRLRGLRVIGNLRNRMILTGNLALLNAALRNLRIVPLGRSGTIQTLTMLTREIDFPAGSSARQDRDFIRIVVRR